MKLNAFEAHPLWVRLSQIEEWINVLRSEDDGQNIDLIDELDARAAQLRAAHRSRRRLAPLLVPSQLDTVDSSYQAFYNSAEAAIDSRDSTRRQYLTQAIQYAQAGTASQGAWPEANPTVADERLDVAVVDALIERQSIIDTHFKQRMGEMGNVLKAAETKAAAVDTAITKAADDLAEQVAQAVAAVNAEKSRIGTVIDEGNSTIAGFENTLKTQLGAWEKKLTTDFNSRMEQVRLDQTRLLEESVAEYETLAANVKDYQTLVQADSADRLAKHYEDEAKSANVSGWVMTIAGFFLLIAAGLPLLMTLVQQLSEDSKSNDDPSWQSMVARVGISAVLVGASTVAIRMGSGFLRRSADYKRLAMELRTMGPFLAANGDKESVDQARLDLVNRTFGQAYVPQSQDSAEDAVPVTVLQQLLTLLTKTASR